MEYLPNAVEAVNDSTNGSIGSVVSSMEWTKFTSAASGESLKQSDPLILLLTHDLSIPVLYPVALFKVFIYMKNDTTSTVLRAAKGRTSTCCR